LGGQRPSSGGLADTPGGGSQVTSGSGVALDLGVERIGDLAHWKGGTIHLGASSIIFGVASYLIVAGFFAQTWRSIGVALVVLVGFGGIFYGVLPQEGRISWEAHLSGALAGVWTAWRLLK